MKPVPHTEYDTYSTLKGRVIPMGIDAKSLPKLTGVLSRLYSDPITAIIREYACNAYDSHVEAGVTRPIEVTLPTYIAPTLRIKDWGVGLDEDAMDEVYSLYGTSTKENDNRQIGTLGLGSKSAFAYTPSFTVEATKNGTKLIASISRNTSGVGEITIVDKFDTNDEPNGVEVIIPASKQISVFAEKAHLLFRFWPEGSVLVDGEAPERIDDPDGRNIGLKVTDDILLTVSNANYAVMGNVPYPIDSAEFDFGLDGSYGLVAYVPLGKLHFTPDRESLEYTETTLAFLNGIKETLERELLNTINSEIDAASTRYEALKIALRWHDALPGTLRNQPFTYHKTAIPSEIIAPQSGSYIVTGGEERFDYYGKRYKLAHHWKAKAIDLRTVSEAIWVHGFTKRGEKIARTMTPAVKKKLWMYCDANSITYPPNFILCVDKPDSPWIDPSQIISWAKVDEMKLPRSSSSGHNMSGRLAGSYDIWIQSGESGDWENETPADDIPEDMNLYYCTNQKHIRSYAKQLAQLEDEFVIVYLTGNRIAKFKRIFPQAQTIDPVLQDYCDQWFASLNGYDKQLLAYREKGPYWRHYLDVVPRVGIIDPDIQYCQKLADAAESKRAKRLSKQLAVFRSLRYTLPEPPKSPFAKYPLIDAGRYYGGYRNRRTREHSRVYINAAYEQLIAGSNS